MYTHKDIVAKLRADLMCNTYSSIWLEIGLPGHKRFLVSQSYREWQQKGSTSSSSLPEQLVRWLVFLEQWERALAEDKEVIVAGDMNINHLDWTDDITASNQTKKLRPLITELFSRIFPHGISQLVTSAT